MLPLRPSRIARLSNTLPRCLSKPHPSLPKNAHCRSQGLEAARREAQEQAETMARVEADLAKLRQAKVLVYVCVCVCM